MKPTVLIGLGGIGSKTVDTIYGMMTEEQYKQYGQIGFSELKPEEQEARAPFFSSSEKR